MAKNLSQTDLGLGAGGIVGVVIAVLFVCAAIGALVYLQMRGKTSSMLRYCSKRSAKHQFVRGTFVIYILISNLNSMSVWDFSCYICIFIFKFYQ